MILFLISIGLIFAADLISAIMLIMLYVTYKKRGN